MTVVSQKISGALGRLALVSGDMGFWEVTLLRAVATYDAAKALEAHRSQQGVAVVAGDLDRFHRSLGRTANIRTAGRHWSGLSPEGRTFIEMRLRMAEPTRTGFGDLDLTAPSELAALRGAVGAARRWIGEKPGTEHGPTIRELMAEVGRVYRRATGKRPGLSSSQAGTSPNYATPFEELLMAVLTEAGTPLSLWPAPIEWSDFSLSA